MANDLNLGPDMSHELLIYIHAILTQLESIQYKGNKMATELLFAYSNTTQLA